MEKTAVEWLIKELINIKAFNNDVELSFTTLDHLEFKAKEMEKEQIRSAYIDGQDDIIEQCKFKPEYHLNSLHYYQKKYESS